jgi:predicted phosphodiesterase
MRIALFADVHGNPDALSAVTARLNRLDADSLYFLGDVVGYLPGERQCLDMLSTLGAACQKGNHEAMLLSATPPPAERDVVYQLRAANARMDAAELSEISSWPERRELEIDGRRVLLVHGSPAEPLTGYLYPDTDLGSAVDPSYDAIVCAHTHRPFVRRVGETLFANAGSVGLPRDIGRLASLAVYDSVGNDVQIWRVPFDAEQVIARWGDRLHQETRACLRRADDHFVGEVIE